MSFKKIKLNLLSAFRELFVYHHRSLEFRAKFFAAMIASNPNTNEQIYDTLKKIALEIYGHDEKRIEVLIRTTKEYVKKILTENGLNLDELILDLDKIIKNNRKYAKKINLNHLRRLQTKENENIMITQQRIIEFAQLKIAPKEVAP